MLDNEENCGGAGAGEGVWVMLTVMMSIKTVQQNVGLRI